MSMRKLVENIAAIAVVVALVAVLTLASVIESPDFWTATATVATIVAVISGAIAAFCNWLLNN